VELHEVGRQSDMATLAYRTPDWPADSKAGWRRQKDSRSAAQCGSEVEGRMNRGNLLEAVLVAVLSFVALLGIDGWFSPIRSHNKRGEVKIRRLPFRLSLRTLLIATTLVAVVLGLIVWAVR
jgi:hypothetical protein